MQPTRNWAVAIPHMPDAENLNPQTGVLSHKVVDVSSAGSKAALLPVLKRKPLSDVTSQYQQVRGECSNSQVNAGLQGTSWT
jgi:hypothetical protein